MRADLAAGARRLTRRDVVAVAGVVPARQQKIVPAVVATARRVAVRQRAVEIRVEEEVQLPLLRIEFWDFPEVVPNY